MHPEGWKSTYDGVSTGASDRRDKLLEQRGKLCTCLPSRDIQRKKERKEPIHTNTPSPLSLNFKQTHTLTKLERGSPWMPARPEMAAPLGPNLRPWIIHTVSIDCTSRIRTALFLVTTPYCKSLRDTTIPDKGAPRRGRNRLMPVACCHITNTASSPPERRYDPSFVKVNADTACACQCITVFPCNFKASFRNLREYTRGRERGSV
jgi:hypothetical protein